MEKWSCRDFKLFCIDECDVWIWMCFGGRELRSSHLKTPESKNVSVADNIFLTILASYLLCWWSVHWIYYQVLYKWLQSKIFLEKYHHFVSISLQKANVENCIFHNFASFDSDSELKNIIFPINISHTANIHCNIEIWHYDLVVIDLVELSLITWHTVLSVASLKVCLLTLTAVNICPEVWYELVIVLHLHSHCNVDTAPSPLS